MTQVTPIDELLDLILQVATFLGVMPIVVVKSIIFRVTSKLAQGLDRVGCLQKPFLIDLEKYLYLGGV